MHNISSTNKALGTEHGKLMAWTVHMSQLARKKSPLSVCATHFVYFGSIEM